MPAIMLDTSVCVRALRDRSGHLSERFKARAAELCISTMALTELLFGAAVSARPDHHADQVQELARRMTVLAFDESAATHAADIRGHLQRAGTPIGGYDTLIAGHARSQGLLLLTGNLSEFRRVPGLRCEDWSDSNS
jgi:tRNA(fMet)-specific endonuclease VapC